MQYIDFKVQHQTITRTDSYEVVGGSQNYLYARFSFCDEWADIIPTAVFSTNSGKHIGVAIENGECLVPWEVLTGAEFWVGVFGGDRITTSTVRVPVKPGAKHNASPGVQPTPPAYEILMRELREGVANIDESEETAENAAAQAAERAAEAAESAAASVSAAADASSAKDVVINALDNIPAGATVIINDLTTGGTTAALSAEMGKVLNTKKANANLLHNWYFANPVNQRGQTDYSVGGYTIDRWVNGGYTCAVLVRDGYVELDGNGLWFEQRLDTSLFDSLVGKQVAFSMLLSDGELLYGSGTVQADGQTNLFYRASDNIYGQIGADIGVRIVTFDTSKRNLKIVAVKLELGDTQTLVHWDGSKWVLNEIPDYGEELAKCQRYQMEWRFNTTDGAITRMPFVEVPVAASANGYFNFVVTTPVPLRGKPGISHSCLVYRKIGTSNFIELTATASVIGIAGNTVAISINTGAMLDDTADYLIALNDGGYLRLDANL